jgi:FkbM family methyltransferase
MKGGIVTDITQDGIKHLRFPSLDATHDFNLLMDNHETALMNLILPRLKKTDVVLDVGAHIGSWTIRMGKRVQTVIAYEPVPRTYEILNENVKLNELDHAVLLNLGASNFNGKLIMHSHCSYAQYSMSEIPKAGSNQNLPDIEVRVEKLNNMMKRIEACDFIKIDVESHEAEVLQGADKLLETYRPELLIEVHDDKKLELIKSMLRPYGYDFSNEISYCHLHCY